MVYFPDYFIKTETSETGSVYSVFTYVRKKHSNGKWYDILVKSTNSNKDEAIKGLVRDAYKAMHLFVITLRLKKDGAPFYKPSPLQMSEKQRLK